MEMEMEKEMNKVEGRALVGRGVQENPAKTSSMIVY